MDEKKSFAQPEITSYEREELAVPIVATSPAGAGSPQD